jgi:hypothetical protein
MIKTETDLEGRYAVITGSGPWNGIFCRRETPNHAPIHGADNERSRGLVCWYQMIRSKNRSGLPPREYKMTTSAGSNLEDPMC